MSGLLAIASQVLCATSPELSVELLSMNRISQEISEGTRCLARASSVEGRLSAPLYVQRTMDIPGVHVVISCRSFNSPKQLYRTPHPGNPANGATLINHPFLYTY